MWQKRPNEMAKSDLIIWQKKPTTATQTIASKRPNNMAKET